MRKQCVPGAPSSPLERLGTRLGKGLVTWSFAQWQGADIAYHAATVIHKFFVVKKFSFHLKRRKFLTRILFTNSITCSEYMAHM